MLLSTRGPTLIGLLGLLALHGCGPTEAKEPTKPAASESSLARAGYDTPGAHRQYGAPVKLGKGQARMYVVLDAKAAQAPLEVGVALDERALEGLPTTHSMLELPLPLAAQTPLPYRYVVLNWNPQGHIPEHVYDVPHFDFHFYWVPRAAVEAILPSDPAFADRANNLPTGEYVPDYYMLPVPPEVPPVALAEPRMGLHWVDVRSPELQGMLGKPENAKPFTHTFIYGSWDGRFTFAEPMVTLAFLRPNTGSRPDTVVEISQPKRYPEPGWYPAAYRVTFDPQAKEYRIGLLELKRRN
jgi:hypothetical protein